MNWYSIVIFFKEVPYRIKWWWQRRTRGWDDRELWSLDVTIAKFVLPRLEKFRETHRGYPDGLQEVEWDMILDEMIRAFQFMTKEDWWEAFDDKDREEVVNRGIEMFGKYFRCLWD